MMIALVVTIASVGGGWLLGHGDAAANARAAAAGAPVSLLVGLLGLTGGLYGRERIRHRRTHASPTVAYVGKRAALAALAASATFVLSPVAWPAGCLPLFAAAFAAGSAAWVGNLPIKL